MRNLFKQAILALVAGALIVPLPLGAASAQSGGFYMRQTSAVGAYLAGLAALESLEGARAADYFLRASSLERDNPIYAGQAFLALLVAGEVDEAAAMAQHVLDLDPHDELARLTLGSVALKQRRYASATRMLARVPDMTLVGITAGLMRAWSNVGEGNLGAANRLLDGLGQGGFSEFLIFHRAILADVGGDRAGALELSHAAHELDPFVPRIAEARIRILANAGDFEGAQAVLDAFADEGVRHPVVDALRDPVAQGRRPGLFASNVQSGAAEMLHGLGAALARDGSAQLGVAFLQLAVYLDPDAGIVSLSLGELLARAGRHDEADAIFYAVPSDSPLYPNVQVRIAENADARGERELAIAQLTEIVDAHPDNVEALGVLGDILRYDEQWEASAEAYSGIIERIEDPRPRDWRYYYVRGIAHERAGAWDAAQADFLAALDLNPDHPDVLNYLGYSWVDRGENLIEALDMIEYAVALAPRNGYIIDSLGWAFFKLGRIDEAIVRLEEAVNILPGDPEINDHLGDAYWVAGREREAIFQWRIAIDVDDRGEVTERARPKLINGLDIETIASE